MNVSRKPDIKIILAIVSIILILIAAVYITREKPNQVQVKEKILGDWYNQATTDMKRFPFGEGNSMAMKYVSFYDNGFVLISDPETEVGLMATSGNYSVDDNFYVEMQLNGSRAFEDFNLSYEILSISDDAIVLRDEDDRSLVVLQKIEEQNTSEDIDNINTEETLSSNDNTNFSSTVKVELVGSVAAFENKDIHDYWVAVEMKKPGTDRFIFDKIHARFSLGTVILDFNATPPDGDVWDFSPDEHSTYLYDTEGKTAEFINMAKNSSQKNILFSFSLENDGKILDESTALLPDLDDLEKNGSRLLDLSPRSLTIITTSI